VSWVDRTEGVDVGDMGMGAGLRPKQRDYGRAFTQKWKSSGMTPRMIASLSAIAHFDLTRPLRLSHGGEIPPFIDVKKHYTYLSCGERGSGKSVSLEFIAETYHTAEGGLHPVVMDLIDGGSGENLFWAIAPAYCPKCHGRVSPIADRCLNATPLGDTCGQRLEPEVKPRYPILLVIPHDFAFEAPPQLDISVMDVREADITTALTAAKRERRILVFGWSLFQGAARAEALRVLGCWLRDLGIAADTAKCDTCILMREAGSYLFSRDRIWPREDPDLRNMAIQVARESRHQTRSVLLMDTQRWQDVLVSIRSRVDRALIHAQPASQIVSSDELKSFYWDLYRKQGAWSRQSPAYSYLAYPEVGYLEPGKAYGLWRAKDWFHLLSVPYPSFHHRLESEGPSWGGAHPDVGFGFRYRFQSGVAASAAAAEEAGRRAAEEARRARASEITAARAEERHRTLVMSQARHIRPASARRGSGLNQREQDAVMTMMLGGVSDREIAEAYGFDRAVLRGMRAMVAPELGSPRSRAIRETRETQARQGQEAPPSAAGGETEETGEAGEAEEGS